MAFDLSVNLEYMFKEAGDRLEDRIAAAAAAGFTRVEMFTTTSRDVPSLAKALADHGSEMLTVVADPSTRLVDPGTHQTFCDLIRRTGEDARSLGCSRIVVGSGVGAPYMKRAVQLDIVAEAVASAVPIAEDLGLTLILEPVNTRVDHPGALFSQTVDAVHVIEKVASPCVRLSYDMYHSICEGEDPAQMLERYVKYIEHVQIADIPGRGEPGSGTLDWKHLLGLLRSSGYAGYLGLECHPTGSDTSAAVAYIKGLAAEV